MTMPAIHRVQSVSFDKVKPRLSVLAPFYKDNPNGLIEALDTQLSGQEIELLVYDDGTGDSQLSASVAADVKNADGAVALLTASGNRGRSFARNQLVEHARSDWVLFLDADMRPVEETFLETYKRLIADGVADIIFGGFTVPETTQDHERELHRALSQTSDCLSLSERQAKGAQYVASSNLCVHKSVLEKEAFDDGFQGWGWEDSEWAARVSKRFVLIHADNPALHLGLETTDTLLQRFKTSGPNYRRFTDRHPELAKTLNLYAVVNRLKTLPGHKLARPLLKLLVKARIMPVNIRLMALKLWRASWYTEAFGT